MVVVELQLFCCASDAYVTVNEACPGELMYEHLAAALRAAVTGYLDRHWLLLWCLMAEAFLFLSFMSICLAAEQRTHLGR